MSNIVFSAELYDSSDSALRSNLGHDIGVQFEIYGCPDYDLDKSKMSSCNIKYLKTIVKYCKYSILSYSELLIAALMFVRVLPTRMARNEKHVLQNC